MVKVTHVCSIYFKKLEKVSHVCYIFYKLEKVTHLCSIFSKIGKSYPFMFYIFKNWKKLPIYVLNKLKIWRVINICSKWDEMGNWLPICKFWISKNGFRLLLNILSLKGKQVAHISSKLKRQAVHVCSKYVIKRERFPVYGLKL